MPTIISKKGKKVKFQTKLFSNYTNIHLLDINNCKGNLDMIYYG